MATAAAGETTRASGTETGTAPVGTGWSNKEAEVRPAADGTVAADGGGIAEDGHQGSAPQLLPEERPFAGVAVDFVDPQACGPGIDHAGIGGGHSHIWPMPYIPCHMPWLMA